MKLNMQHACPMKWGELSTFDDKSKFCNQCSKKIYDFENSTKEEIELIMTSNDSVCAKIPVSKLHEWITPFQKVLLAIVICFSGSLFNVDVAFSHEGNEAVTISKIDTNKQIVIRGTIQDSIYKESVFGAVIRLKGTKIGAISDMDGRFEIKAPNSIEGNVLVIKFVGYKDIEIPLKFDGENELDLGVIQLEEEEMMIIGIVIPIEDGQFPKGSMEQLFQEEKELPGF